MNPGSHQKRCVSQRNGIDNSVRQWLSDQGKISVCSLQNYPENYPQNYPKTYPKNYPQNHTQSYSSSALPLQILQDSTPANTKACSNGVTISLSPQQWLHIEARVPGSHACNELRIRADSASLQHLASQCSASFITHTQALESTLFHARFSALSNELTTTLSLGEVRILIMAPTGLQNNEQKNFIDKVVCQLRSFKGNFGRVSIGIVGDESYSSDCLTRQLTRLKSLLPELAGSAFNIVSEEDSYTHFHLYGIATLVISDSKAVIHDALLAGTAVITWDNQDMGIADIINELLVQPGDESMSAPGPEIATQQRSAWLMSLGNDFLLRNNRQHLYRVLEQWLDFHAPDRSAVLSLPGTVKAATHTDAETNGGTDEAPTVMPMAVSRPETKAALYEFKASLDTTRRKFIKFRQSPSRFVADSQHPWLKSLKRQQT